MSKKLEAAAKETGCELIKEWQQSIINHMYWSAISTTVDQCEVIHAKWELIVNHTQHIHRHESAFFPDCGHEPLRDGKQRKWFKPGKFDQSYKNLCKNVT